MDKKTIQQMLEIDQQAQTIHENALKEAAQLLVQAEKEAPDFIEKARQQAELEAKEILARSQSTDETARIMADTQASTQKMENLAQTNFDKAVAYVLARVVGRE
jgi:vacuolar-type H+-ATPase subunit H